MYEYYWIRDHRRSYCKFVHVSEVDLFDLFTRDSYQSRRFY